jgi:nucleotide-binding universal stress UspA family protein
MPLAGGCLMRSVSGRRQMKGSTHHRGGQIVVGVDGTAARAAAIRWAVREARLRRARVHLVFAGDHGQRSRAPYAPMGASRPVGDSAAGTVLGTAEQEANQTLPLGRRSAERTYGSPAQVLIDRSAGAGLLVLGSAYPAGQPATGHRPSRDRWRRRARTARRANFSGRYIAQNEQDYQESVTAIRAGRLQPVKGV